MLDLWENFFLNYEVPPRNEVINSCDQSGPESGRYCNAGGLIEIQNGQPLTVDIYN